MAVRNLALKPGLLVVSEVGAGTVTGILKVIVIFIIGMNDLPCQGNPLIEVLEKVPLISEGTIGVIKLPINVGEGMVHTPWIPIHIASKDDLR